MQYITHERQCFIRTTGTEKRTENKTPNEVVLTKFELFEEPMKHCLEC